MSAMLNILIVEDSEIDVQLLQHTLRKAGFEVSSKVVNTPEEMRSALKNQQTWDVITSDHSMPQFSAPEALAIAKELRPEIPFIILSGEIDLNLAVSLMKGGAQDYIQKHEMARIIPAIERELKEVELERDRQRVGFALEESDNRFREVLENSLDASYKRDFNTNAYEYLSPVFAKITGYTPGEINCLPLESVLKIMHPEDITNINKVLAEAVSSPQRAAFQLEYRFKHKNGHYIWLLDKFSIMRDAFEQPQALIGSVSDISERKQAEEELLSARRRLESIIEGTRAGTWEWNVQTGETVFNERWAQIIGYTLDDIAPISIKTWETFSHPEDLKKSEELLEHHFAGELPHYDLECRMKHKDGNWVWVHDRGRVITRTADGKPLMMYGTHIDITERKAAEETLIESELKYHSLIENSSDAIFCVDVNGEFKFTNQIFASIFGKRIDYYLGKTYWNVFPKEHADHIFEITNRVFQTGISESIEVEVPLTEKTLYFHATANPIKNESGRIILVLTHGIDISDRKRSEDALRESEALFRTVFESAIAGISMVGANGKFLEVNDMLCKIVGYSREELLKMNFNDVTIPEDKEIGNRYAAEMVAGKIDHCNFEKRYQRKDGKIILVFLSISAIRDHQGKVKYFVAFTQDFTERMESE